MAPILPTLGGGKAVLNEKPQKAVCIRVTQNIPFLSVAFWNQSSFFV